MRDAGHAVVGFSPGGAAADLSIKRFLLPRLYRHERLLAVRRDAEGVVTDLFRRLTQDPSAIPEAWRRELDRSDPARVARRVADYIAGHDRPVRARRARRLFARTPDLRLAPAGPVSAES